MDTLIPVFPCKSFTTAITFYQTLGFSVDYRQDEPYCYGAVSYRGAALHLARLTQRGTRSSVALVSVEDHAPIYRAFADSLRRAFGRVPTAGTPRLTRPRPQMTRFHVFDPSGNVLIYVDRDEQEADDEMHDDAASPLAQALRNAVFLRDTYTDDVSAAKLLDRALAKSHDAPAIDRARALAARAELAVAMNDAAAAHTARTLLAGITLSDADRDRFVSELTAADALEHWISNGR